MKKIRIKQRHYYCTDVCLPGDDNLDEDFSVNAGVNVSCGCSSNSDDDDDDNNNNNNKGKEGETHGHLDGSANGEGGAEQSLREVVAMVEELCTDRRQRLRAHRSRRHGGRKEEVLNELGSKFGKKGIATQKKI